MDVVHWLRPIKVIGMDVVQWNNKEALETQQGLDASKEHTSHKILLSKEILSIVKPS